MKKMLNQRVVTVFGSIVIAAMVIASLAIVFSVKASAATKVDVVGKYDMVVYGLLDCEYSSVYRSNGYELNKSYDGGYSYTANNKTYQLGQYDTIFSGEQYQHLFSYYDIAAIIAVTEANAQSKESILSLIQEYNWIVRKSGYPNRSTSSSYGSDLVTYYDGYYNGANLNTAKSLYSDIYKQITEYPPFTEYMNR